MPGPGVLASVLRHEQRAVTICLLAVTLLSWSYLLAGAGTMQEMGGMSMPMSTWPWSTTHAWLMLVMWLVMMVAMMLPSAAPVILLYSTICRASPSARRSAPGFFTLGYLAVWSCFSIAALLAQFLLEWSSLLSPMMESASVTLSGVLLIAAGIYQFTPLKRNCLALCRSPLEFLMSRWRPGRRGAFMMGARHGLYCLACCWSVMLLLFVGGLMNLLWIIGIAVFVLLEKLLPGGQRLGQAIGAALVVAGAALLLGLPGSR
jgi:predicted metal-binding membrane protein